MIEINGTPLYGKDSTPQIFSAFVSVICTFVFFLIFIICLIFIKAPKKAPKYKEVQIVLDTSSSIPKELPKEQEAPKVIEKVVEQPIPIKEEVKPPVVKESNTVTEKKTESKPKPVEKPKAKPNKKAESKVVEKEPELWQSNEDLLNQQLNSKPKKKTQDIDWDAMFGDEEGTVSSSSSNKKVTTENKVSGRAGTVATEGNVRTVSSSTNNSYYNDESSGDYSDALADIRNTKFVDNSSSSATTEAHIQSASVDGSVIIQMDNGKPRRLINPSSPKIELSEEAIKQISGSPSVTISIKVITSGNVSEINFTPESVLPLIARNEIKNQIRNWQFDPADYVATAHFEYNIVKR